MTTEYISNKTIRMLNKGLRDEESIRIDNVLKTLRALDFVPQPLTDDKKFEVENQLKEFGLHIESLVEYQNEELIRLLVRCHLDFNQLEQFADFLMEFSKVETYNFKNKALALYQYIQNESNVFSFGINTKIASAKNQ
ncbi:hypothetical protein EV142_101846 [Flavobacterium circumlabens]|uniref:TerB family tellurite resistance protein n=2 Tax=Flavobacterium circumlabens TaxID=2133765 RepID=A0ABY2B573_9FLAO|nr:hypothetical protein EV142_101846 [Flavobacterium circumlabens]